MNDAKNKSTSGVESGTSGGWESRLEEDFKRLVNPQRYASLYQQHWLPKGSQTPIYKLAQELNSNKDFTRYLVHLQILVLCRFDDGLFELDTSLNVFQRKSRKDINERQSSLLVRSDSFGQRILSDGLAIYGTTTASIQQQTRLNLYKLKMFRSLSKPAKNLIK